MNQPQLRLLLVALEGADYTAVKSIPLLETIAYSEPSPALTAGADEQFDALLLDGAVVESTQLIEQIAAANPRLPLILVARDDDQEEIALAALELGADDYLMESELTSVAVCGTLRNARRARKLLAQRDEARDQLLRLQRQGHGVPLHFAEQLRSSAGMMDALAAAVAEQVEPGSIAASMSATLAEETTAVHRLAEDLVDARKLQSRTVVLHRRPVSLGEIAEEICGTPSCGALRMQAEADWELTAICDRQKTIRAAVRIVESLQSLRPGAEIQLVPDDAGKLGIRLLDDQLSNEQSRELLNGSPVAAGEAGFQRHVAVRLLEDQQVLLQADEQTVWLDLPTSAEQLTGRWTQWLSTLGELSAVTLFEVETPQEIAADVADTYLHNAVTARDLVMPRSENRWLIAVSAGGFEAESRMRQLSLLWSIMAGEPLRQELVCTYHLPLEHEQLEQRIGALLEAAGSGRILVLDRTQSHSPLSRRLAEAGYDVVSVDSRQPLTEAPAADAIVGDAESLEQIDQLPANIPVFLLTALKGQQRALEQNVQFVSEDNEGQYDELIDALSAARQRTRGPASELAWS